MNMFPWLLGATALLLLALTMEKLQALRYRRALRHIIHVNGTRGKSSVVRLIDAALRENGVKVLSKSTGTLPMILHVDGRETQLRRHAPANIREQLALMRLAVREGAEVLVIECMAVDPQLQYAAQHQILQADIGVLTNVRLDHQDVMGDTLQNVLHSLLNTVPRHGVLYTAEEALYPAIAEKAGMEHTACHLSRPRGTAEEATLDFPENVALAAAVAEELGISYANALQGMKTVRRDPYAMELLTLPGLCFVNAMSSNDVQSAQLVLQRARQQGARGQLQILINNRADRPARAVEMLRLCRELAPERIYLLGEETYALRLLCRWRLPGTPVQRLKAPGDLLPALNTASQPVLLLAAGNIKGQGMELVDLLRKEAQEHVQ